MREVELQAEVLTLRRRLRIVATIVGLLVLLVRMAGCSLDHQHNLSRQAKAKIIKAIERARGVLTLRIILRIMKLSSSRFHAWVSDETSCQPADGAHCPRRMPNQLTPQEVGIIGDMVTSPDYRHVPTSRLALLAQRLGKVFASPSTWAKLVQQKGWRRPRLRIHPAQPKVGLRTSRPDEAWHVDITIVRLLDGTKAYVHAVIDNFSRRILAFRVSERFQVTNASAVLRDSLGETTKQADRPMLVVDGGKENFNGEVDELQTAGLLRRERAQAEVAFSNSMIEAFWRTLKHQYLFMHRLDSVAAVRRHVTFYVKAHNSQIPPSAFNGRTPDEVYFGKGENISRHLATKRKEAQQARVKANQAMSCDSCPAAAA
jgi:transposase InsO family protein